MNRNSARREPPVDRHRDGAEVVRGEDRREEFDAVVRQQPDDIAGTDASGLEAGRQFRGPVRHPLIRDRVVPEDRDGLVRRADRMMLEHSEPADVGLHRRTHYGAE